MKLHVNMLGGCMVVTALRLIEFPFDMKIHMYIHTALNNVTLMKKSTCVDGSDMRESITP